MNFNFDDKQIIKAIIQARKDLMVGNYPTVVFYCSRSIEDLLRSVIKQTYPLLNFGERNEYHLLEKEIGNEEIGVEKFPLGRLIQFMNSKKIGIVKVLARDLDKDPRIWAGIDLHLLLAARNKNSHNATNPSYEIAQYILSMAEILCAFFNIRISDYEQ